MLTLLRRRAIAVVVFLALALMLPITVAAEDAAEKTVIKTQATPHEIRNYKVTVAVKGKMPSPDTGQVMDLDVTYDLKVQHRYGRREADGMLPVEISVTGAEVTANGERLTVIPSTFPKLTVLLDKNMRITDVFGLMGYPRAVPGINYGHLIVLFYLAGTDTPRAVGEQWSYTTKFAPYKEQYQFKTTLKSLTEVDGVKSAVIGQEMQWVNADSTVSVTPTATVESVFSLDNAKLLKSKASCDIVFGDLATDQNQQDTALHRANIRIDISLAK